MKINIKSTKIRLTPSLENFIHKKIGSLERFLKEILKNEKSFNKKNWKGVWIEIEKTTHHHKKGKIFRAEGMIELPGKLLRAEALKESIKSAITEIKEELQRQILKYKNKRISQTRRKKRE